MNVVILASSQEEIVDSILQVCELSTKQFHSTGDSGYLVIAEMVRSLTECFDGMKVAVPEKRQAAAIKLLNGGIK